MPGSIALFYSYADSDEDRAMQKRLEMSLEGQLKRMTALRMLHRGASSGRSEQEVVRMDLAQAQIVLVLISSNLLAKKHSKRPEAIAIEKMLQARQSPNASASVMRSPIIIPILLESVLLDHTLFNGITVLPSDGRPINQWQFQDQAFLDIVTNIRRTITTLPGAQSVSADTFSSGPLPESIEKPGSEPPAKIFLNIPSPNQLFTGRERLLENIHQRLMKPQTRKSTQILSLSGREGIGKTQIATEYVYRFYQEYQYILWLTAENRDTLSKEYVDIAQELGLPEPDEQNQTRMIEMVRQWLQTHSRWLLVLDNLEKSQIIEDFVPDSANGYVLLTTQESAILASSEKIEVPVMQDKEGTRLLLRQKGKIISSTLLKQAKPVDRQEADAIFQELDGLPLALDQAGAYIERTDCRLDDYLQRYRAQSEKSVDRRRGASKEHPLSVKRTSLLALGQVEQLDPAAADLLRLCAFLAPEGIPEDFISNRDYLSRAIPTAQQQGTGSRPLPQLHAQPGYSQQPLPGEQLLSLASDASKFNRARDVLLHFSLLHRDDRIATLNVHRLVGAVLKDDMPETVARYWANFAINVVSAAFPAPSVEAWPTCQKLLPQVYTCSRLINDYDILSKEALQILDLASNYLFQRAQYPEAEYLLLQGLGIQRKQRSTQNIYYALFLHRLGELQKQQARYKDAEKHIKAALEIRKKYLFKADENLSLAESYNSLAELYRMQKRYREAEPLYNQALAIHYKVGIPGLTAKNLDNLATLYQEQKKYAKAEELYNRALTISKEKAEELYNQVLTTRKEKEKEKALLTAQILHNLAGLYKIQGRIEEAKPLYEQSLTIREQIHRGTEHPEVAASYHSQAELLMEKGEMAEAEQFFKKALKIRRKRLGDTPETAESWSGLAKLYQSQGKVREAEQAYQRAIDIQRDLFKDGEPTLQSKAELARFYEVQRRDDDARERYEEILKLRYKTLKANDPAIDQILQALARLYRRQGKLENEENLYEYAFRARAKNPGLDDPATDQCRNHLMTLYSERNKAQKIEALHEQVFEMRAEALNSDPQTIKQFHKSVEVLNKLYTGRPQKQVQLYKRAFEACFDGLGPADPLTDKYKQLLAQAEASQLPQQGPSLQLVTLNSTGIIGSPEIDESKQQQFRDEEQHQEKKLRALYKKPGLNHPETIQCRDELIRLYESHGRLDEVKRVYKASFHFCKQHLPVNNPYTLCCQNDLVLYYVSQSYLTQDERKEAGELTEEMLDTCEALEKANEPSSEQMLALIYGYYTAATFYYGGHKGEKELAERLFKHALTLGKGIPGTHSPLIERIRNHLANRLRETGRFEEADAIEIDLRTDDDGNGAMNPALP